MSAQPFRILVVCRGNHARSQMAHGWLSALGGGRIDVASAGIEPKGVHPTAVAVMGEVGIDISHHRSDHVERYLAEQFDLALTVCDSARETCPILPGARRTAHRSFEDPDQPGLSGEQLGAVFRRIRGEIGAYCRELLARELG